MVKINNPSRHDNLRKPLMPNEAVMRRRCRCGNSMKAVSREVERDDLPALEQDVSIIFSCEACGETVKFTTAGSAFRDVFIGVFF